MSALVVDYCLRGRWLVVIGAADDTFEEIAEGLRRQYSPADLSAVKLRTVEAAEPPQNEPR